MNLIATITLDNFNSKLYKKVDYNGSVVDTNYINNQLAILNNQETAVELAQILIGFEGVAQADIYDKNDNLIFKISSII
jgi:hypothetical protein